jgi:lysophospholipase
VRSYRSHLGVFCGGVALLLSTSAALAEPENPFGLVREAEFEQRLKEDIEPYWEQHGEKGTFTGVDGIQISYMTFVQEHEAGAIVISSGRTESYVKYKELIFDLGRQGYSVYIHDHRGQGYSGRMLPDQRQKGHVDRFDDYVSDLDTFVRTVVLSKPHQKLFLLGHSMGGGIATLYIERHPDVFHAAALSSPMHAPDVRILESPEGGCWWFRLMDWLCYNCWAGFVPKPYEPKTFADNEYTHSEVRYQHLLNTYQEHNTVQLGGPTRGWCGQACAASPKMLDNTKNITIPALVLQAGTDTAVTPEGQNTFCQNLKEETGNPCYGGAPQMFDGAKHELFIESDEYRIPAISTILDFFSRVK